MVSAQDEIITDDAPPLIVGVTGHRDLVPREVQGIEEAVRELLTDLASQFPDRRLRVMSPLAEGADRIVARVAESLGIDLAVPLPMPEDLYVQDFESSQSWAEFGRLNDCAVERTTLPLVPGESYESISEYGDARNRQYAEVGAYIAERSDILIAVWDGKTVARLGGTGDVVNFRREGEMSGYVPHTAGTPLRSMVFHIVCSRNRAHGEPAGSLEPLQTRWLGLPGEEHVRFPPAWAERLHGTAHFAEGSLPYRDERPTSSIGYRVPLIIGVTGHRDLRGEELPAIRSRVRDLLSDLKERFPHRRIVSCHHLQKALIDW